MTRDESRRSSAIGGGLQWRITANETKIAVTAKALDLTPTIDSQSVVDVQQNEDLRGWSRQQLNLKEKKDYMR